MQVPDHILLKVFLKKTKKITFTGSLLRYTFSAIQEFGFIILMLYDQKLSAVDCSFECQF